MTSRRDFLKWGLALLGAGAVEAGVAGFYVAKVEPAWHRIEAITVPMPDLPAAFEGYRIIQLSDLHVMSVTTQQRIIDVVGKVGELERDLIVITGDYVTGHVDAALLGPVLDPLTAPDGVWTVMGNHDHWTDVAAVRRIIEQHGIQELRNANTAIEREDEALWVAGVDDIWEQHHDLDTALAGIPPSGPTVLLAHEPDYADQVAPTGRVHLQLSGHSHGGQIRLPMIGPPVLPYLGEKYPFGLRQLGPMHLYTNRGAGGIPPNVRLNCRPEITVITLTRKD